MTTYVALLRGINVGRTQLKMAALRALFADLGYADAKTYVQSGNVLFTSTSGSASGLAKDIEQRLTTDLGVTVTVLLRTAAELAKIVAHNPFLERGAAPATLHVTFLAGAPDDARAAKLDPPASGQDELDLVGREVYIHCPNGYGRTKLSNAFLERRLGTAATTRNWKTVTALCDLANG